MGSPSSDLILRAFFRDGSLRDLPMGADRVVFHRLLAALETAGWILEMGELPTTAALMGTWTPERDGCLRVGASCRGIHINLWAWCPQVEEGFLSEIDLCPVEIDSDTLPVVLELLRLLVHILGRAVVMTPEGCWEELLLTQTVDGQTLLHLGGIEAWEV